MKKMKKVMVFVLMLHIGSVGLAQELHVVGESSLYISGDPVRMQVIVLDQEGIPSDDSQVITTFLAAHDGTTVARQRFMITPLEKGAVFLLPADLETGRYKLISVMSDGKAQNEVLINVYNPSVFSSSSAPKNADSDLGIDALADNLEGVEIGIRVTGGENRASLILPALDQASSGTGVALVHVFHNAYGDQPVAGRNVTSNVGEITLEYDLKWLTEDPNARVSFYFLDQGLVEEYYLADGDRIYNGLKNHYGGGPVWAYQFDGQGNRLGAIPVDMRMSNSPVFGSFMNVVPYNEKVRNILENKRIRKYVDQVYRSETESVESLLDEEYDMSADATVRPDRYEGYATLREALANIVPKTQVIRRSGLYEIRLSPSNSGFRYPEKPLVLVNGIPTFETDSLMDIPFSNLERISIFNSLERLRRFGTLGRFGVVDIRLKADVENPLAEFRASLPVMQGISDAVIGEPSYTEGSPDLRSDVFWDPSIRIYLARPNEVSWPMSDLPGIYRVWGLVFTPDGKPRVFNERFNHLYR